MSRSTRRINTGDFEVIESGKVVKRYTAQEIETMRFKLAKRDATGLKESDVFMLAYYGCIGYNVLPIENIVTHYEKINI
jgi:hypothetical protein